MAERQVPRRAGAARGRTAHWCPGKPTRSGSPSERCEMPVVALAYYVQIEAKAVYMSFSRPGKRQALVCRVRRVIEIHGLIRSVARSDPLDLEGQDVRDHCRALEPVQVELDQLELDPAKIADQMLTDESWRTAGFATDDGTQGRTLRIVGPLDRKSVV